MRFTVATYNIHKGFTQLNRRMVIHELRDRLHGLVRRHPVPAGGRRRPPRTRGAPPRLAGQAAARIHRRHGLARGRLRQERDLAPRPSRQRRAVALSDRRAGEPRHLGARVREPRTAPLRDRARARARRRCTASTCTSGSSSAGGSGRSARCASASARRCPTDAPLIIAGDFNDWRHKANRLLVDELGVVEVFEAVRGRPARTFPSVMPVFRLDRIYARGPVDRRRARPLRVSRAAGSPTTRRSAATFDTRMEAADEPVPAGQPRHAAAERRRILSGAGRTRSIAPSARSGSRPTSTPTTTSARIVTAALVRAAQRGIVVRVLVDGWGAKHYLTAALERELVRGGVTLLKYRPEVAPWQFRSHRLRRLHRKLCHVDGRIAFVGGINIIDDVNTPGQKPPRVDFALRIEGPLLVADRAHDAARLGDQRARAVPAQRGAAVSGAAARAARRRADGEVPDPRQPAPSPRHRARLPRGDPHGEARDPDRQLVLLSRHPLPPRADRRGAARRRGDAAAAGTRRVPAAALRDARAVRAAARPPASRSRSTTGRSCTRRSRWSTTTGRPSARRTSTRTAC